MGTFMLLFVIGHLFGDFVLQNGELAKKKSETITGLWQHVGYVILAQGIVLYVYYGLKGLLASFMAGVMHICIDYFKYRIGHYLEGWSGIYFLLDQFVHLLGLWFIWLILRPDMTGVPFSSNLAIYILSAIIILYVQTVFVKMVLRDKSKTLAEKPFFMAWERPMDGAAGFGFWLVFLLGYHWLLVGVVLGSAVAVVIYQHRAYDYSWLTMSFKYVVFIGTAFALNLLI